MKTMNMDSNNSSTDKIEIKIHHRTPSRCYTSIKGLDNVDPPLDVKKIMKYMRNICRCSGVMYKDINNDKIIKLEGDQRDIVKLFLIEKVLIDEDWISIDDSDEYEYD